MRINKLLSVEKDVMKTYSNERLNAPYFMSYSFISINRDSDIENLFKSGFNKYLKDKSTSYLKNDNLKHLKKVDIKDVNKQIETSKNGFIYLWREIKKGEVEFIYDLRLFILLCGKRFSSTKMILENKFIEIVLLYEEPILGDCIEKRHYDRELYRYIYHLNVSKIESLEMEITYYDLSKFGETKYLDIAEKKIYSLDLKNPDMDIYKLMNEYGMLEIDWED